MAATGASLGRRPINVGVLGLGPRWRKRYGPALLAMQDRFRIRVLGDAVRERADQEARRLSCLAAAGPTELVEHADIDALLVLDAGWYRLWPLELACRRGLPVFCAPALELDEAHADSLVAHVRERDLFVMVEMLPQLAPAATRLRELLDTHLGPIRLMFCDWSHTGRLSRRPGPLLGSGGGALLDWCAALMAAAPRAVQTAEAAGLASVLLEFPGDRAVQVVRRQVTHRGASLRVDVVAEAGRAVATPPCRVRWTTADGHHRHTLPAAEPLGQVLLDRFHRAVTEGRNAEPNLEAAHRALAWLRAVARSRAEGRRVEC